MGTNQGIAERSVNMPVKDKEGRCDYCLRYSKDTRLVQLRHINYHGPEGKWFWASPLYVCKYCRYGLRGVFRYTKEK